MAFKPYNGQPYQKIPGTREEDPPPLLPNGSPNPEFQRMLSELRLKSMLSNYAGRTEPWKRIEILSPELYVPQVLIDNAPPGIAVPIAVKPKIVRSIVTPDHMRAPQTYPENSFFKDPLPNDSLELYMHLQVAADNFGLNRLFDTDREWFVRHREEFWCNFHTFTDVEKAKFNLVYERASKNRSFSEYQKAYELREKELAFRQKFPSPHFMNQAAWSGPGGARPSEPISYQGLANQLGLIVPCTGLNAAEPSSQRSAPQVMAAEPRVPNPADFVQEPPGHQGGQMYAIIESSPLVPPRITIQAAPPTPQPDNNRRKSARKQKPMDSLQVPEPTAGKKNKTGPKGPRHIKPHREPGPNALQAQMAQALAHGEPNSQHTVESQSIDLVGPWCHWGDLKRFKAAEPELIDLTQLN